ncbi:elongation of very long chain fatty acids protein AAEL008004 [Trichonephila clavata]|uniref:Elongation of very long chain fatty acids protein n=1 Tax=Trichonephila clavata TaxID=2740835 RepID=A0A8X6F738_TRICU|nr:elongation of very long chain fatty acids protein AAEL008004 [Trichonephila clavata]
MTTETVLNSSLNGTMAVSLEPCVRSEYNWVQDLADTYHRNLIEKTDPVVMTWPLVSRDRLNLFIIFCYVMFVNVIGPTFMKNRKPFDLRWLMVPYNVFLVIVNFYVFIEFAKIRLYFDSKNSCTTLDLINDANTYRLAEITWWFFLTKYIELADTVFFVLRKKDRQLSRLHLVHHSTVPILVWGLLRSEPGGHNTFFPLANAFVHCVMYAYYAISALGDDVTIHLKFKKYVTMMQMTQFVLVLCYFASRPFVGCNVSPMSLVGNLFLAGFFFVLFCNFYWNEYLLNREQKDQELKAAMLNGKKKSK